MKHLMFLKILFTSNGSQMEILLKILGSLRSATERLKNINVNCLKVYLVFPSEAV